MDFAKYKQKVQLLLEKANCTAYDWLPITKQKQFLKSHSSMLAMLTKRSRKLQLMLA